LRLARQVRVELKGDLRQEELLLAAVRGLDRLARHGREAVAGELDGRGELLAAHEAGGHGLGAGRGALDVVAASREEETEDEPGKRCCRTPSTHMRFSRFRTVRRGAVEERPGDRWG